MLKLFSVFDSKVGAYTSPTVARSSAEAMRQFGVACNSADHQFFKWAEDFTLFELGEWDELTGTMLPYPTPLAICKAIECSGKHSEFYFASRIDVRDENAA